MEAVKEDGESLEYALAKLQDDRDIVMVAVKQCGNALLYASSVRNYEIAVEALKEAPEDI